MENTDSLAKLYLDRLKTSNGKQELAEMFFSVFDEYTGDKKLVYMAIASLVNLYGKLVVFQALLDCYDMKDKIDFTKSPHGIISYFCKVRTVEDMKDLGTKNLDGLAKENKEFKQKKLVIPVIE
jgi:hypothetical protein